MNKFITFFIITFFSCFLGCTAYAEEIIVDDVAPFSNEINYSEPTTTENSNITETKPKSQLASQVIPTPTLIYPKIEQDISGNTTISGISLSGSIVKIYIDGVLDGSITTWPSKTGVSGFFYELKQKLTIGNHTISVQAEKDKNLSKISNPINFIYSLPHPTPTVITPYAYAEEPTTYVVRGLVKSGDSVDIFIDGKKIKTIKTLESETGVSGFRAVIRNLKDGWHNGYFISYSKENKQSPKSKKFYFNVESIVSPNTLENKNTNKENIKTENKDNKESSVIENSDKSNAVNDDKMILNPKPSTGNTLDKNKSMVAGFVLLGLAVVLIGFWLITENKVRIKKLIDKLFDEDDDLNS